MGRGVAVSKVEEAKTRGVCTFSTGSAQHSAWAISESAEAVCVCESVNALVASNKVLKISCKKRLH